MAVIRVDASRLGEVQEIMTYLRVIEDTYNHLCAFGLIMDDFMKKYAKELAYSWPTDKARSIRTIKIPSNVIMPEERLVLHRVRVESPGFWDFLGKLNPLEVLRQYLSDRHERRKDKAYREGFEAERMRLDNERLKTQVVNEQADLLREHGVPEDRIREALVRHLIGPLKEIDRFQDSHLIAGARIIEEKSTEK